MLDMEILLQGFGEHIGHHFSGLNPNKAEDPSLVQFGEVTTSNSEVAAAFVMCIRYTHCYRRLVVLVDGGRFGKIES